LFKDVTTVDIFSTHNTTVTTPIFITYPKDTSPKLGYTYRHWNLYVGNDVSEVDLIFS